MRTKVAFAVALILAVAAVVGTKALIEGFKTEAKSQGYQVEVAIAAMNLKPGDIIDRDINISVVPVAGRTAERGTITKRDLPRFLGEPVVRPVRAGDALNELDFIKLPSEMKFTQELAENHRAMTIAVDQVTGVAGLIRPKDRVDVLATLVQTTTSPGGTRSVLETITILENIPILATDSRTAEHDSMPAFMQRDGRRGYTSVTLSVTPEEARILTLAQAQSQGMLALCLRSPLDSSVSVGRTSSDDLWNSIQKQAQDRRGGAARSGN